LRGILRLFVAMSAMATTATAGFAQGDWTFQRGIELVTAAGHEASALAGEHDGLVPCDLARRGARGRTADRDPAALDCLHRARAAAHESAPHQLGVEAAAHATPLRRR